MCKSKERPLFLGVTCSVAAGNPDQTLSQCPYGPRGCGRGEECSSRREEAPELNCSPGAVEEPATLGEDPTAFPRKDASACESSSQRERDRGSARRWPPPARGFGSSLSSPGEEVRVRLRAQSGGGGGVLLSTFYVGLAVGSAWG